MNHQSPGRSPVGNGGHRHRVRYERSPDEPASVAVAGALAAYNGEDVCDSSIRLYDYVDPDALDALFADRYDGTVRAPGRVEFTVRDATVVCRPERVEVY